MYYKIIKNKIHYILLSLLCYSLLLTAGHAQLCTNNKDTLYGLTTTGQIVSINVLTGLGNTIGAPTGTAVNSNGVGFSAVTGLFYFFNKNGAGPQQFVSFNPLTGALVPLAASPISATHVVRSGCVNNLGSGYYTIDSVNSPSLHSNLIYYNIPLNSWKIVTSVIKDPSNNPIPEIDTLISGDMAIDGNNNLWIICSSKWFYALYEIKGPLPTSPTASITAIPVIPLTPIPGTAFGKVSFTGVAFNSKGDLYLTLGNNPSGNKLFKLTSGSSASLTLIGPIGADLGADLTSCIYPTTVLPVKWIEFRTVFQNNAVLINWKTNEYPGVSEYIVESSIDNIHWHAIAHIQKNETSDQTIQNYYYKDYNFNNGVNYYRVIQTDETGKQNSSITSYINTGNTKHLLVGPNPANATLYLLNKDNTSKYSSQIFDLSGKLIYSAVINPDQQSIDISHLEKGTYFMRLKTANTSFTSYQFTKW
jgi:Secretion system C-terminal sorting domain